MHFSHYPGPRRCRGPLVGHKTTEHRSASSSPASPVPIHATQEQKRYQEPSSGKRRTMPATSQRNAPETFSFFFIFPGSKKHSRTGTVPLVLHRHPLLLPPSLHPSTNHKWKRRFRSYQLLQRATQSCEPDTKPPVPFKNQLKVC